MWVLGILLLAIAVVLTIGVVMSNTGSVGSDFWGLHISNLSIGEIFLIGIGTGIVGLLGLYLLQKGLRHTTRRGLEHRKLRRENARLSQQQAAQPGAYPPPDVRPYPPPQNPPRPPENPR